MSPPITSPRACPFCGRAFRRAIHGCFATYRPIPGGWSQRALAACAHAIEVAAREAKRSDLGLAPDAAWAQLTHARASHLIPWILARTMRG